MSWVPLKRVADVWPSNVDKLTVEGELPVRLINYTDVYYGDRLHAGLDLMTATASEAEQSKFQVHAGDVLLTKDSETADDIGIAAYVDSAEPGVLCGYHLSLVRPRDVDGRYLYYALSSRHARLQMSVAATGVTRFGLRADSVCAVQIWLPGRHAQRAIAEYLDSETTLIDAMIAKKQHLIGRLDERIDASIMQIVGESRLVDPVGAPVNDLRRLLRKVDRRPTTAEMITAFRDGQVTTRTARGKDGFTNSWTDGARIQGVQRGDVVVHGLDGFSGAIGDSEADGVCSPVYHVCEPADGGDSAFYGRMLRLLAVTGYLGNFAVSTRERAVDFRNWDLFGRIPIPVVDASPQRAIGDRIRALRPLVELVERSEALAVERKNALITQVITGGLSVT